MLKQSEAIRQTIISRIKETGKGQREISKLATNLGMTIFPNSLNRYLKYPVSEKYSLTEEQIIFLCKLLCIDVTFRVGVPTYDKENNKVVFYLREYNEQAGKQEAMAILK